MQQPEFIQLLTSHQSRLYAYILSLVYDTDQADDVLQQTNMVLWQKQDEFVLGSNFVAWIFRIAYFQVQAYRQKINRDRLVFDDALLGDVAEAAAEQDEGFEQRQRLLRHCLEKLNERQRDLICRRYRVGATIDRIAVEVGQSANAIKQALFRARMSLMDCVQKSVALEPDG